uniref:adhesive domain-containing protein n=1 Tax=Lactococcus petauri TaxID=1940789 RepID=UPI00254C71DD
MKERPKNRFREKKRHIGLLGFLTVLVVSVTFLGLAIPKIMAGDTQVSDLILQGESKEQSITLTLKDEHPEDTKIVIPLPEGITYTSNSNPNIGVTYDELNNQLVIDWVEGEEKQVELQLEAEQEGRYDFTARTVRDGEPVTSSMIHILITISNGQDEISNSTIEEDPNFINQKKNGTAQDNTEENSIDLENSSNISSTGNNVKDDVESIDSWMPDKNLQAAVSKKLNIPAESLTQNDMLSLTSLD